MRIKQAVQTASIPRADAEVLLAHLLGKDRSWLIAHANDTLNSVEEMAWSALVTRRQTGEPVAYITGTKEFYERSFLIDRRALIPRPSTERLVELALDVLKHPRFESVSLDSGITGLAALWGTFDDVKTVIDIGTGSGCIGVTMACEQPDFTIIATDISKDALQLAEENAKRFRVTERVSFRLGNGLEPIDDVTEPFLLVSNPPYIKEGTEIMEEVRLFEPSIALWGGKSGGEIAEQFARDARSHPFCRGIVIECETDQAMYVAKACGFTS